MRNFKNSLTNGLELFQTNSPKLKIDWAISSNLHFYTFQLLIFLKKSDRRKSREIMQRKVL